MDFFIETKELQRVVRLLGVTAKVNTYASEGCVLIEASDDNTVLFLSRNNSTSIKITSENVEVSKPGLVVVSYGKIKAFVNSFSPWNGEFGAKGFNLIADERDMNVFVDNVAEDGKKAKGKLKLKCFSGMSIKKPKEFGEPSFILNSNMLKKAINKIIYAVDPNEPRGHIQGINISFGDEHIYFVCTNGLTLSEYKVKNNSKLGGANYTFKYDFMMGLKRALGEETQIFFEVDDRSIIAKFDDVCFYGKLVIGHEYPQYKPLLDRFSNTIVVGKEALLGVLSPFMDILNNEDNNRISFEIKDKKIMVYNDEASFDCAFDVDYDEEFAIDVNGRFLFQTIDAIDDNKILIKFSDDKNVLNFDSENFKDQKALITPVRRR